jgi:hypothetical protein
MPALPLIPLDGRYAVCRLDPGVSIPAWAVGGAFTCVTRTADELSVVCRQEAVPAEVRCERGWRGLRVAGTLDFAMVGVLASLVSPLAEAGVSVFVVSTFDSDYLLVKEEKWATAVAALREFGHVVRDDGAVR